MARKSTYDTLRAMAADIQVMNDVLRIAYENVGHGLEAAESGDLDVADAKVAEICDILWKTTTLFTDTLAKHKLGIRPETKN